MSIMYEKRAFQFLAFYRFLSYALAVMFTQVEQTPFAAATPDPQLYVILGTLGVYSLLKVFSPVRWRENSVMTYLILGNDFLLSMLLVVYTGGLNSNFLLYSLTPIMTAALLFEERVALTLAALASIALSVTHMVLSQFSTGFAPLMQGLNFTLLITYTLFCFVSASVPYRTNLNIRRRIETDAIIEERRRIARELHDGMAQSLGYLNLKTKHLSQSVSSYDTAKALAELDDIRKVVHDTYDDVRESIDQLSSETRNLPLIPALTDYLQSFGNSSGLKVNFDCSKSFSQLSPVAELQLLRIAQEALTNVRRHARASQVEVKLGNHRQVIEMLIKDDGQGFVLEDLNRLPPGYHGLNIVKERAEMLGGTLNISTAPGQGTALMVSLPVDKVRL